MQLKEVIFQEPGRRVAAFPEHLNPQVTLQGWPLPLLMQKVDLLAAICVCMCCGCSWKRQTEKYGASKEDHR